MHRSLDLQLRAREIMEVSKPSLPLTARCQDHLLRLDLARYRVYQSCWASPRIRGLSLAHHRTILQGIQKLAERVAPKSWAIEAKIRDQWDRSGQRWMILNLAFVGGTANSHPQVEQRFVFASFDKIARWAGHLWMRARASNVNMYLALRGGKPISPHYSFTPWTVVLSVSIGLPKSMFALYSKWQTCHKRCSSHAWASFHRLKNSLSLWYPRSWFA